MYGTQMVAKFGSSSQGRRARKQYNPAAFTRAGALKILSETQDLYVCSMFEKHENKHVQARAVSRAAAIASAEIERIENRRQETVTVAVVSADDERFNVLVERFKAEGKPDPVKSAKASIAAQKAAASRTKRAVG